MSKSPETISIGDGNEAKSYGETKPIVMKIRKIFKHTGTYTVMELGKYDLILGMPFFLHSWCAISFPGELPEVKVTYKQCQMILPLRTDPSSTVKCFHVSRKDFELDSESSDEIFQIHYSCWRTDHPKPKLNAIFRHLPLGSPLTMIRLSLVYLQSRKLNQTKKSMITDLIRKVLC